VVGVGREGGRAREEGGEGSSFLFGGRRSERAGVVVLVGVGCRVDGTGGVGELMAVVEGGTLGFFGEGGVPLLWLLRGRCDSSSRSSLVVPTHEVSLLGSTTDVLRGEVGLKVSREGGSG